MLQKHLLRAIEMKSGVGYKQKPGDIAAGLQPLPSSIMTSHGHCEDSGRRHWLFSNRVIAPDPGACIRASTVGSFLSSFERQEIPSLGSGNGEARASLCLFAVNAGIAHASHHRHPSK
jgi:hypothetical protein